MTAAVPERRTAMYHAQVAMGAVMMDADGWQLPVHYGDVSQESVWLRETAGVSDVSSIGKLQVVGEDPAQSLAVLLPVVAEQAIGSVGEADSPLERGGKLLAARLSLGEFLLLTPTGAAPSAMEAMRAVDSSCAHVVEVTSALCGVSIIGPATQGLFSRITELDTSPRALPDLSCVQSRFADIQGLLLRRDVQGIPIYQLYAGREFGEYLWEVLIDTAREVGGGPVGTEALSGLRVTD